MTLTFGSLFAGIGGFDLGFERAGMRCVWQVEKDEYCQSVLAKHWPDVLRWDDVCTFPPIKWRTDAAIGECDFVRPDVICGGFPCQDISQAGKREGIDGARSGLWAEYSRIIRVLRPKFVVVENVAALLIRGLDRVLGDLAGCGYDAEWFVLPASAIGAPQVRERVFVVAYPNTKRRQKVLIEDFIPDEACSWDEWKQVELCRTRGGSLRPLPIGRTVWVGDGISEELGEIERYGNAVVPQVAEWIGRRLIEVS